MPYNRIESVVLYLRVSFYYLAFVCTEFDDGVRNRYLCTLLFMLLSDFKVNLLENYRVFSSVCFPIPLSPGNGLALLTS